MELVEHFLRTMFMMIGIASLVAAIPLYRAGEVGKAVFWLVAAVVLNMVVGQAWDLYVYVRVWGIAG